MTPEQLREPDPPVEHIRNAETILLAELELSEYNPPARRILVRIAVRVTSARVALQLGQPAGLAKLLAAVRRAAANVRRLDAGAGELLEDVVPRLAKASLTQ